ncbi:hypothetical protein GCM10010423_08080 [Streptomyces levis]|uniref:Uncharacterized protein n=1 Tax=Streptomyces levis TaxID=285566 RepID=A0ABN3NCV2_9ACTN
MCTVTPSARSASAVADSLASLPATAAPRWARIFAIPDIPAPPIPMKCGRSMAVGRPGAMRVSLYVCGTFSGTAYAERFPDAATAGGYALLCENSFSTGTPTLCRAREAQSRWKNSST